MLFALSVRAEFGQVVTWIVVDEMLPGLIMFLMASKWEKGAAQPIRSLLSSCHVYTRVMSPCRTGQINHGMTVN